MLFSVVNLEYHAKLEIHKFSLRFLVFLVHAVITTFQLILTTYRDVYPLLSLGYHFLYTQNGFRDGCLLINNKLFVPKPEEEASSVDRLLK